MTNVVGFLGSGVSLETGFAAIELALADRHRTADALAVLSAWTDVVGSNHDKALLQLLEVQEAVMAGQLTKARGALYSLRKLLEPIDDSKASM